MPRDNLSATVIKTIKVDTRTDFFDTKQNGLVLRASPSGVMAWTVIYTDKNSKKKQRATLGKWPDMDTAQARSAALGVIRAAQEGKNPSKEKKALRHATTVKAVAEEFLEKHSKVKKRTWKEDERILRDLMCVRDQSGAFEADELGRPKPFAELKPNSFGKLKLVELKRADVVEVLDKKASSSMADHALALLRKLLNWAVARGKLEHNPAAGVERRAPIVAKDRVLSADELEALWKAMPDMHPMAASVFALLALTGQRLGEVCGMVANEVDIKGKTWTIPAERTKNGRVHLVPLSGPAVALLAPLIEDLTPDAAVLSRGEKPMDIRYIGKLARELQAGEDRWTPHDLRRTVATGMAGIEVLPHVIEAVLNHVSGAKANVAGIYNRYSYAKEKRAALEQWADHLGTIVPLQV